MDQTNFLIGPSGAYKLTAVPVKDIDKILKQAVDDIPTKTHGVFKINGRKAMIVTKRDRVLAGVRMDKLVLRTHYKILERGGVKKLIPVWSGDKDTIEAACEWVPPATMNLALAVNCSDTGSGYSVLDALLFAVHTKSKEGGAKAGFFKLPLPNIHGDARICLGNDYHPEKDTVCEMVQDVVRHMEVSPWNTDLQPDQNRVERLFAFDPSTLQPLPPNGEWETICDRVSRIEMEELTNAN